MTQTQNRTAQKPAASRSAAAAPRSPDYGAQIQPSQVAPGAMYWKITGVRHLPPDENRGRHNIFVDAIDEQGQRVRDPNLRIHYTWEGRRADEPAPPKPLDKPDNEPAGNLDVYKGQIITAWLEGDGLPSERVAGLHTDHNDEQASDGTNGNTRFHHSFQVTFQQARAEAAPVVDEGANEQRPTPPPTQPSEPPPLVAESWPGRVNTAELRLRLGPGTDHVQIGSLFQGDLLQVTGRAGEWLAVSANGQSGFVHSSYVEQSQVGAAEVGHLQPPPEHGIVMPSGASSAQRAIVNTWNQYGGLLLEQAAQLDLDPGVAVAVLVAESKGEPFGPDGRMIIRFENHIFYQYWGKANEARFRQHFSFDANQQWKGHHWRPDPNGAWQPMHEHQAGEWQVFEFARRLDERAAMLSISMGAPQIMGFNHTAIGYTTVQAMFHAFQADVREQLVSFFRFMTVHKLVDAVRGGDYVAFARIYNGPGQADHYAGLIREYRAVFEQVRPPQIARAAAEGAVPRTPMPPSPLPGKTLAEADPKLYEAWRTHIIHGFENNQLLFQRTLNGFMRPYWITVGMYGLLFAVGIIAFVVAIVLALRTDSGVGPTAVFGGLSAVAFLAFFLSRPLQALEENLQFITWLGIVYNTYWTRLVYLQDLATVQEGLSDVTDDTITHLQQLMDKHTERSQNRPNLPTG